MSVQLEGIALCSVRIASVHVRADVALARFHAMDLRVAFIGNVDSGKSTLIGVLTRAELDDGRGSARGAFEALPCGVEKPRDCFLKSSRRAETTQGFS